METDVIFRILMKQNVQTVKHTRNEDYFYKLCVEVMMEAVDGGLSGCCEVFWSSYRS